MYIHKYEWVKVATHINIKLMRLISLYENIRTVHFDHKFSFILLALKTIFFLN